jgi:hypothetical protein
MKKILTLLFTLTVALSLAMSAWAIRWPFHLHKHAKAEATTDNTKAHDLHAKKKGATKGKKEGQEGTNPGHHAKQ